MVQPPPQPDWDEAAIHSVAQVLNRRWGLPIIRLLWAEPVRRADLSRQLDGISEKVLTVTLRELMARGFVIRHFFEGTPPKVTYRLSEAGYAFGSLLEQISAWATNIDSQVTAHRSR